MRLRPTTSSAHNKSCHPSRLQQSRAALLKYGRQRNLGRALRRCFYHQHQHQHQAMGLHLPESAVAGHFVPSIGTKAGVYAPRKRPPVAVIIHTTGSGPVDRVKHPRFGGWRKVWPQFATSPFEAAKWTYMYSMRSGPHYLIGQSEGEIVQLAREGVAAWHVGSAKGKWYKLPKFAWCDKNSKWWQARFPELKSPADLAKGRLWEGWSCNNNSIGIEVSPPLDDPRAPWSDAAWKMLTELCTDIAVRHNIPLVKTHILSHSDSHPRTRSAKGKPWDPGERQWTFEEFKRRLSA